MLLIFDWDGTLVDSRDHIVAAMQRAMVDHQLPILPADACARLIGLGLVEIFEQLYPGRSRAQCSAYIESYSQHFVAMSGAGFSPLFPDIEVILTQLNLRGHVLAIATGKSRRGLDRAFEATNIKGQFVSSRTADETASKPSPLMIDELISETGFAKAEVIMIGDTSYDLDMAGRAGIKSVGVSYGVHSVADLEPYKPLCIVERPQQLLELAMLS